MDELKTSPEFSPKLLRFKPLDIKRPDDKDSFSRSVAMVKKIPRNYVLRHMCEGDVCQGVLFSSAKAVSKPEVGDTRVSFQYAPAGGTVSLIGTKTKSGIGPFIAKSGRSIALASRGKVDAEELLRGAVSENTLWTWLMRGGGVLLAFVGLLLVFSPINALASYLSFVPLLGSLVGGLVGMAVFAVALLGALLQRHCHCGSLALLSPRSVGRRPLRRPPRPLRELQVGKGRQAARQAGLKTCTLPERNLFLQ